MLGSAENEGGRTQLPPPEQKRSLRLRWLNQSLLTSLVLIALLVTIAFWCWAVWWGASKQIGLMI
jgi:hypothetical protein